LASPRFIFCNPLFLIHLEKKKKKEKKKEIYLEGDAKNVVDALLSLEANWSKSGHIIAEAQLLLQDFIYWEIKYVSREANFAARNLAKLAAILGLERQWMDEIPDFISEIIRGEQVSLPH
jgi:hypothetical protein